MNRARGWMSPVLIILISGFVLGCMSLYFEHSDAATDAQIRSVATTFTIHNSLQAIHNERQATIFKIVQIIERYNKRMSDSLKHTIADEIYTMSLKYPNLNPDFIVATITHESAKTWDPKVTSNVGAMGLMQVMPATGAFLAVEEGVEWHSAESVLYDPILNIRLGCRYLNELVGLYEKDGGLAAYNGGPRRAEMWIAQNKDNRILWEETRHYIPAVLKLYDQFRSEGTM